MNFEEYERHGREAYAALASTIAAVLMAAIGAETGYRLQQVKDRAKQPASLLKKLEDRGIAATATLEDDIKDLAGCRVIFYTNNDVTRFINSGIIHENFDVVDVKIHQPRRGIDNPTDLYTSNHYIVRLRPERTALPEYARFAGMLCEIQIQTILNHAWAEMAHDTIYKVPTLGHFGADAFAGIKNRMQKVALKYLVPAGYEFQKIASDFERLIKGKELFDGNALEAIVDASDNNGRAEALERLAEYILPFHDDMATVYPEIVERLVTAAERAKMTPQTPIETPFGTVPGKTYDNIVEAISEILRRYRYLDVSVTFDALCRLYGWAESEDGRKALIDLGSALAKHNLAVWRTHGPVVQAILVDQIAALGDEERRGLGPLLTHMLGDILSAEVSGTTSGSTAVTFHRGSVAASAALRDIRTKAIDLLKHQFALAEREEERRAVLLALRSATRRPLGAYSKALAQLVLDDTCTILQFLTEIVSILSLDLLEATEYWVHHCYRMCLKTREATGEDPDLVTVHARISDAALAFRDVANANADFVIYKTLVGFQSVFPPAWVDMEFEYRQANAYRAEQVDALLASVNDATADVWFDRICRYARTESDDLATFPVFGKFLERLAAAKPRIVLRYIDRLDEPLSRFLPGILSGLTRSSESGQAFTRIDAWLLAGEHIGHIAWYLRYAEPFDEALLRRTLDSAISHGNASAVRNVLLAAVDQFEAHPGTLIDGIFLPALRHLHAAGDYSWIRLPTISWLDKSIIRALDEHQAAVVLDTLIAYPDLEGCAEHVAASIAERWPARVAGFIGDRQAFARTDAAPADYDAVPFSVHQLQRPLSAAPDAMLENARTWFEADERQFSFDGGRLLASVFPDLAHGLKERLDALVATGREGDLKFVLGMLSAFEGKPCVFDLVRSIVAAVEPQSPLLAEAESVLSESGVVSGEFGFAQLHEERKELLTAWLVDPSEAVRAFATKQIRDLDRSIAAESRAAEASIALRKLDYGEELDGDGQE
jgi:ppGpp synthetase/RelA/SpoT-type nucleotidyltranferase